MNDLISRQDAIERIDAVFPVDPMKSEYAQGIACGAALAKTYVEQLPSAQKKGHWLPIIDANEYGKPYQSGVYCSECGHRDIAEYDSCPNCGADMRGEQDE